MIERNNNHVVRLGVRSGASRPTFAAVNLSSHVFGAPRVAPTKKITDVPRSLRGEERSEEVSTRSTFYTSTIVGVFSKVAVLLIVPVLIFRPLLPLYAADESVASPVEVSPAPEVASPPVTPAPTVDAPVDSAAADVPASDATAIPSDTEEVLVEETTVVVDAPLPPADVPPAIDTPPEEISAQTPGAATTSGATPADALPAGGEVPGDSGEASSTPVVTEVMPTEEVPPVTIEEVPVVEEVAPTEEVDSIEPVAPELTKEEIIARELESRSITMRQELKKEIEADVLKGCLTLDGVGYYCLKDNARAVASGTPSQALTAVHADVVVGGTDKEIIADRGTEMIRLTDNDVEDAFPAKDVGGTHVVWQTEDSGRWQIFFADVSSSTPTISQLTHGTESNFNPRVDGGSVVWQGWVDGGWEIFLADQLSASSHYAADKMPQLNTMLGIDASWHVVRITQNSVHDMFPAIAGGLVTWQSFEGGVWSVYAYSVMTGKTTKLSDDGTKSENPRFAVTWDERGANGETRMMGYDIATGGKVDMTQAARNVQGDNKPYVPQTPQQAPEPLALPGTASTTGTSTAMRGTGEGGDTGAGTSTDTTI